MKNSMGELLFMRVKNSSGKTQVTLGNKSYAYFWVHFWIFLETVATTIPCFANSKENLPWMKAKNMLIFPSS